MHSVSEDLELDDGWAYGPGILHGGFLLELLATHGVTTAHPHPLAVSTHFLRAPRLGAARLEVTVLREGRTTSTTRVALVQDDRVCLDQVVTAGLLGDRGTPLVDDLRPPDVAPLEECLVNRNIMDGTRNGIIENLDFRVDPSTAGWLTGATDVPEIRGWLRSRGREVDPLQLVCLADGVPPVPFTLGMTGWVPTVEMTVHVRAVPAPGWLRVVQRVHLMADGWLDEEVELWDSADVLVAQARQLAGYRLG